LNLNVGLQYGAYPPKIAESIKCSIEEAQSIFDRYHSELYSNVTKFREEVVLPAARANGEVHMGLGAKILTDDPKKDERTLVNSCSQYWSILTLFAINKLHQVIDDAELSSHITVTNTIYDALYGEIDNDPALIYWLNKTLPLIMISPFLQGEIIHNEADLEIGLDWASFHKIDNSATLDDITNLLSTLE
jgi:hypothetical protein